MDDGHAVHELRAQTAAPLPRAATLAIGVLVSACCFVLALALAGVRNRIGTPPAGPDVTVVAGDVIVAVVAVGGAIGIALQLLGGASRRAERALGATGPKLAMRDRAVIVAVLLALAALQIFAVGQIVRGGDPRPTEAVTNAGAGKGKPRDADDGSRLHVHWTVLAGAAAVALASLLVALALHRRRSRTAHEKPQGALAGALAAGIEDLETEPDPRRAVIKAYARMEDALAVDGLPRAAAETPLEYLRRGLGRLRTSGRALARLTALFEVAKFSRHEVDEPMRDEALAALHDLRADLQEDE
jgi:hypothetical protein